MGHEKTVRRSIKVSTPIRYNGNLFFLILFLIIWLPVGILMLIKNGSICSQKGSFSCFYHGSWGWLFFWGVLFFPVATLLLILKGIDIIEDQTVEETIIERY